MPIPVIYTDHLVLRPCEEKDSDQLTELSYQPDLLGGSPDSSLWAICRHLKSPLVGVCGFRATEQATEVELLYSVTPQCWAEELAVDAYLAVLSYIWETTNSCSRVYAKADPL